MNQLPLPWEEPDDLFAFAGTVTHPINCPQCGELIVDCVCPTADEL